MVPSAGHVAIAETDPLVRPSQARVRVLSKTRKLTMLERRLDLLPRRAFVHYFHIGRRVE